MPGETQVVKTLCRLCEPGCGVQAHVQGGRLVKVDGWADHPTSQGFICPKAEAAPRIVHAPERLIRPLRRAGEKGEGRWEEFSWESALQALTEKLTLLKNEYGAECVALFRGQAADWGAPWQYALRFMFAFGSPNTSTPSHICYFPRVAAENLTYGCFTAPDYDRAQTIVEWGACRIDTHLPAWLRIQAAQRRGARLIVVDPVRSKIAERATLWLQVRPGTDGALALGIIHVLVEEALFDREFVDQWTVGFDLLAQEAAKYTPDHVEKITLVPAEKVRQAARLIATGGATAIYTGNGLEHHTSTFQTLRAIASLKGLAGTIDEPGGNLFLTLVKWAHLEGNELLSSQQKAKRIGRYNLFTDMSYCVPFPEIVDSILTEKPYPIRALIVLGGNPAVSMPHTERVERALRKLELLVVLDPLLTRTAQLADLVLPAATQFEKTGLIASTVWGEFGDYALLKRGAVAVEDSWPDWKILFELAGRLGLDEAFPWSNVEEAIDYQLSPSGLTVAALKARPGGIRFKEGEEHHKYERDGFATKSGKVEFYSQVLEDAGYDPLPRWQEPAESPISQPEVAHDFPLIGCSAGKTVNYVHTQFRHIPELRKREPDPWVRIHPGDARSRGIREGDWVKISSPRGNIRMKALVTDATLPGVLSISPQWGESIPAAHMNLLIDDRARDPVAGSTGDRSFLCQAEKL
jgi:anaerobic selenocysteine-containing dehydrogenase